MVFKSPVQRKPKAIKRSLPQFDVCIQLDQLQRNMAANELLFSCIRTYKRLLTNVSPHWEILSVSVYILMKGTEICSATAFNTQPCLTLFSVVCTRQVRRNGQAL